MHFEILVVLLVAGFVVFATAAAAAKAGALRHWSRTGAPEYWRDFGARLLGYVATLFAVLAALALMSCRP